MDFMGTTGLLEPRTDVVLVLAVAVATVVSTAAATIDGKTFDLAHKRGRCACGRKPKDRKKKTSHSRCEEWGSISLERAQESGGNPQGVPVLVLL